MPAELQERVPVPHHHAGIVASNIEKVAMHLQQQRNREASMVKVCWTGGDAALPETGTTGRDGAGVAPPAVVQLLHRWRERERERCRLEENGREVLFFKSFATSHALVERKFFLFYGKRG